ncbi:S1 RNA-binding domain-containing protein 1-like [Rhipicephalus sanguineus]|uniref:S1 RNA-binding domain-containing protein 1-like n=1 Tax=Rhipicephalus sanguineus TaxID=34632 RepID=UPI0018931FBF|nr:S1 RNA-binding domain-containing protein 1-like [Rhipicephalus sanguineus]
MDDDSVCVIESPSSSEADDNDDVDYSPTAPRARKAGTKNRAPAPKKAAAKRAATPRRKQPELIDLVSPATQGTASGTKAAPAAGRKRKLGAAAAKSEASNGAEEAEAKPLKRARTDLPDYIPLEGPMRPAPPVPPKKPMARPRPRKPAATLPKKLKLEKATSSVSSVAKDPTAGTTPDAAIDVEAEWEARYGWRVEEAVASTVGVQVDVVRNVVNMLSNDCTIPFIARYRREQTGGLQADGLQDIQDTYASLLQVKKKARTILETLTKENKGDPSVRKLIIGARSSVELDHLYAPYKESKGRSLAQRAKNLGLEETAQQILRGEATVESINPESLVKADVKGLQSAKEVLLGWQHILADVLSKDRTVLDYLANMAKSPGILLTASKSASAAKLERQAVADGTPEICDKKYDNYANFSRDVRSVQPHQVLAINRGESQKVLTVKLVLPPRLAPGLKHFCESCLRNMGVKMQGQTAQLVRDSIEDAYTRLLEPHLLRSIRSQLTKEAEKESVSVFRSNLRQLLLTPPVRGHAVLGIDPGFKHGCKLAAVSANGSLLQHAVIYPHSGHKGPAANILRQMVHTHNCDLVALGNGTACRETEAFLSELISKGCFEPVKLKYCTVEESGVSVYSVTKDAEAELPGLDPNIRSAVGIARRLQDPLLEYVKVEPKHLGVGMYQHDVTESLLKSALEGVVVECVSFVGVDINVCPELTLRKVSGLNAGTARNIVEWRTTNGPFRNRQQLLKVKRLGNKAFEQCAGFVKVFPETASAAKPAGEGATQEKTAQPAKTAKGSSSKGDSFNPLDMTVIHPESYTLAEHFISHLGLDKEAIGKPHFIEKVRQDTAKYGVNHFVNLLGGSIATMQLIVDALQHSVEYDIRSEQHQPLFKSGVLSLDEVHTGLELTGKVKNCTNFGAFVDIGVGTDGLIHVSQMNGQTVALGDRVTVRVINIERDRRRIGLRLLSKG